MERTRIVRVANFVLAILIVQSTPSDDYGYTLQIRGIARWQVLEAGDTTRREVQMLSASSTRPGTSPGPPLPANYTIERTVVFIFLPLDTDIAKTTAMRLH